MNRVPLESTTLASAAYSSPLSLLELEFRSGAVYCYFHVPPGCFHELLESGSKGTYFNRNIRNRFRYQQLRASHPRFPGKTK